MLNTIQKISATKKTTKGGLFSLDFTQIISRLLISISIYPNVALWIDWETSLNLLKSTSQQTLNLS